MSSSNLCLALSTFKVHQLSELAQVGLHLQVVQCAHTQQGCMQGAMTSLGHPWNGAGLLQSRRPALRKLHRCRVLMLALNAKRKQACTKLSAPLKSPRLAQACLYVKGSGLLLLQAMSQKPMSLFCRP